MVENIEFESLRPIHPFPARMAPSIAMSELQPTAGKRLRVLDPMAGSGTTIVLAKLYGHRAFGFDVDPLAILLANAWTTSLRQTEFEDCSINTLAEARVRFRNLRYRDGYPSEADDETKKFVRYWFDDHARRQLRALADSISHAPEKPQRLLWAAFSRTIIAKARGVSLAMDLSHSRPHKKFTRAPLRPFDAFIQASKHVVRFAPFVDDKRILKKHHPDVSVSLGDARHLSCGTASFDLVITSPPYLNAIDYIRCSKFALVWMSHSIAGLRDTRSTSIGAEVGLPDGETSVQLDVLKRIPARRKLSGRWRRILDRYILDIGRVVSETSRVLREGGRAVFVVGDSRVRGVFVSNSRIVELLAETCGFTLVQKERRQLMASRRYLPPPKTQGSGDKLHARMGYETILRFEQRR